MSAAPQFPSTRLRRLRYHPLVRELVRETRLDPSQLILPLFARSGRDLRQPIGSMPGHFQLSPEHLAEEAKQARSLGLGGVILFGIPSAKDATGSGSLHDQGIVQQAVRAVKDAAPDLLVITDVCFCEYTDHGHCGIVNDRTGRLDVDNDQTSVTSGRERIWSLQAG
jgi:porphobilinogen synthase